MASEQGQRIATYIQFMLSHPTSSYLRDYFTLELNKSGKIDESKVPQNYLFCRKFSRQVMIAPDGEVLTGKIRDESNWTCLLESLLNDN